MAVNLKRKRGAPREDAAAQVKKHRDDHEPTDGAEDEDAGMSRDGESVDGDDDDEWGGLDGAPDAETSYPQPKSHHTPSAEEVTQIRDATSLFRSGSFKLQIDALLPTVRPLESRKPPLERFLLALHTFLLALAPVPPTHPLQGAQALSSRKGKGKKAEAQTVHVPYPQPLPGKDVKWSVAFVPPEASGITLVGSWPNKQAVKGLTEKAGDAEGARFSVDLAIDIPDSLLQEKDYLDNRFFHKRAFYLARIAAALTDSPLNVDVFYTCPEDDLRRTVLVLRPRKDGSATDFSKLHAEVRLIPTLSPTAPLALARLSPAHANLRLGEHAAPTPLYNTALLLACTPRAHLLATHALAQGAGSALADGRALLQVWAAQRGYAGVSPVSSAPASGALCVAGCEGLSRWWCALLELVVNGEEPAGGGSGKRRRRAVGKGLSSYQLFRIVLAELARQDFVKDPVYVKTNDGHRFPPGEYSEHHKAVLVDSSSLVNVLADVPLGSLDLLRHDAKTTLERIDGANPADDPFTDVFLKQYKDLQTRFDVVIRVDVSSAKMHNPSIHETLEHGSVWKTLLHSIGSTLREGLGTRAKVAALLHPPSTALWPPTQAAPAAPPSTLFVGLVLDPENAFRLVDHGPAAADAESPESARFRALWGAKAELRRFKDGRIAESVVWDDVRTTEERARIPVRVVEYLLGLHFGIEEESVRAWQAGFDRVLRMPESVAAVHPGQGTGGYKAAMGAFDALVKTLKAFDEEIPLGVTAVSPASPYLRYTSPFAPVPIPASGASALPACARYLPAMELVLEFEGSGRWPDELKAIQKIKLAFFERLASALVGALPGTTAVVDVGDGSAPAVQDQARLEVRTPDGWAFALRIWHAREATLLGRVLDVRSHIARPAPNGTDVDPREKREAAQAREVYLRRFVHAPRHHRAVAALNHRFGAYAGTVRLVLRWLAAHWVLHAHVAPEAVELLCAKVFLGTGAEDVPGSKERGFARVVEMLKEWRWEEGVRVPLYEEEAGKEGPVAKQEGAQGVWRIETDVDPAGWMWTGAGPGPVVARRVKMLAAATWDVMGGMQSGAFDPAVLFKHPTEDYDFIVELNPAVLPRYFQNVAADPSVWARKSRFANIVDEVDQSEPVRPGFDPAQMFFDDLQRVYRDTFVLFWDPLGGDRFGGVWDPALRSARPFRVRAGFSSAPVEEDGASKKTKDTLVVLNEQAVLAEIQRMGEGLVKRIVVQV